MMAVLKPGLSFISPRLNRNSITRLFSSTAVETGVSRISTLKSLLKIHGAPGSVGCNQPNDLVPVDGPEIELHPHLFPIAKSEATGNFICGLRRAYADDAEYESSTNTPWPIVESSLGSRGMQLLALNSEHLMRRIACEADNMGNEAVVDLYNEGLGEGVLKDAGLDALYEKGSVEQLG